MTKALDYMEEVSPSDSLDEDAMLETYFKAVAAFPDSLYYK